MSIYDKMTPEQRLKYLSDEKVRISALLRPGKTAEMRLHRDFRLKDPNLTSLKATLLSFLVHLDILGPETYKDSFRNWVRKD